MEKGKWQASLSSQRVLRPSPVPCLLGLVLLILMRCCPTLAAMSTQVPAFEPSEIPADARVAIVAARFNEKIVDELLVGCLRRLAQLGMTGAHVSVFRVPGAFEIPVAAQALALTKQLSAVICLGCIVRGDTPHFDFIANETARGVQQVAIAASLPVIFGVLTTNTEQQAWDRAGGSHGHAGERAAEAALEMIAVLRRMRSLGRSL